MIVECPNCYNEFESESSFPFPSSAFRSYRESYLPGLKEGEIPMSEDEFFDKFYYFDKTN